LGAVSITDHAQESLGDVVFVELPAVGSKVSKGGMYPFPVNSAKQVNSALILVCRPDWCS
jgi:glycine cleavage system H lipoate-binding protein